MKTTKANLFLKVVTAYAGAVIGAGFASGQEIMQFFILQGKGGLCGSILVTLLFSYLGGLVVYLAVKNSTRNYKELIGHLMGEKYAALFDGLSLAALFGGLAVMISGSAAVFQEHLGLKPLAGRAAMVFCAVLVVLGGLNRVLRVNVLLVPLKMAAVLTVSLLALAMPGGNTGFSESLPAGKGVAGHWVPAGLLYVSYNMIVPVAVLSSLGPHLPAGTGVAAGVAGGLFIGLAVLAVALAGLVHYPELAGYEVPMLILAGFQGIFFKQLLLIIIWVAMLTTAVADVHGLASRLAPEGGKKYAACGVAACLLALIPACLDFSLLVRLLYPLFGYGGLFLLLSLLAGPLLRMRRR
ncbi:MAG: hypothetical protein K6T80_02635 [Firmicutes bacterium]|nr:hypothetical protein [Bacillota bacterium]